MAGMVACYSLDADSGMVANADTSKTSESVSEDEPVPSALKAWKFGSRPLILLNIQQCNSSTSMELSDSSETDLDAQFEQEDCDKTQRKKISGLASPQRCMVCGVGFASKKVLAFHLKQMHPSEKPYKCALCDKAFNNNPGLASHTTNVHHEKIVSCKHCSYTTISRARMRLHM